MAAYGGRIVKLMGDGMLAEFPSVVDASPAPSTSRRRLPNAPRRPRGAAIAFRIGINLGDVVVEEDDLLWRRGQCRSAHRAAGANRVASRSPAPCASRSRASWMLASPMPASIAQEHRSTGPGLALVAGGQAAAALASAASTGSGPPAKPSIAVLSKT